MLDPAPTTQIDPHLARGVLEEILPETATRPAQGVLRIHNSDYRLHLVPAGAAPPTELPAKVIGRIRASARRVDVCRTGGKYLDPVVGTPRRVQGRVLSNTGGVLVVDAGVPVALRLTAPGQKPEHFEPTTMVTCEVLPGATFEVGG